MIPVGNCLIVLQLWAGCVRYCVHVQYNGGVHPVLVSSVTHWSSSTRVEQVSTLSRRAISAVPTLSRMSVTESRWFLFSLLSAACLELRSTGAACKGPRTSEKIFWYTYPLSKLVQPVRKILWGEAQGQYTRYGLDTACCERSSMPWKTGI